MKKLNSLLKVSSIAMVFTLFVFQGCNEAVQDVSPNEIDLELSKAQMDWGLMEWTGEAPDPCKQVCLVAGQHMNVGSVDVAVQGNDLIVTYNILEEGIYLEEVHLDIFVSEDEFKAAKKISNGGAIPGKFEYKMSWSADDMVTSHSVLIPEEYINEVTGGENCFFVASHAALSNGETAWGGICNESEKGVTLVDALQFPGNNWSVYFEFCMDDCVSPIDFTYAWEDLKNSGNDADYNDLVIQSDVLKTPSQLIIDFYASARGAAYDHAFKIKVPKLGVISITGNDGIDSDPNFWYVTVFPSTKVALPAEGIAPHAFAANTAANDTDCEPTASAQIVINIDGTFVYDENVPYEPFITVFPTNNDDPYDLYVWEISWTDTWIKDGKEYPNGILIPDDWQWPIERNIITSAYPNFSSITDGWNPDWAEYLADPSKVWSCSE